MGNLEGGGKRIHWNLFFLMGANEVFKVCKCCLSRWANGAFPGVRVQIFREGEMVLSKWVNAAFPGVRMQVLKVCKCFFQGARMLLFFVCICVCPLRGPPSPASNLP
jgi:hypothetical protein